jgi:acetylornithine deacetylase/succinyl-diaminopimelate desuccinylase-like protein
MNTRRAWLSGAALILTGSAQAQSDDPYPPVDWEAAGAELTETLAGYLQVDTYNPVGNETRGAEYLADVLSREGVPWEIHEHDPGRGSLVARLKGSGAQEPLCLLSHIDVVPGEDEHWREGYGPLSGRIDDDGVLWGRGALDMKGMGAIELYTMILLARHRVPLERDIVLLAVADEEVGQGGMGLVMDELWDEIGCSHVVNEGGFGLEDMFFEGQDFFPISVGEKGVLWLRMIATGEPGHGSTPRSGSAVELLRDAMEALDRREAKPVWHPALLESLASVGAEQGGVSGFVLQRPTLVKLLLRGKLMGNDLTRASITTTVNITGLFGAAVPNVVGGEAGALLDCRLQPGVSQEAMLAELEALVDSPRVRFEVLGHHPGDVSDWDDPFYRALAHHAVDGLERAVAGPVLSVGYTDSILARQVGAKAYGLIPFLISQDEIEGMHGHDERVPLSELHRGLQVLFRAVFDVSYDPGGSWIDPGPVPPSPFAPPPAPEPTPTPVPEGG